MWLKQTLLAVTAVIAAASCICATPAWAQYSVFAHDGVVYTNVIVNNVAQTLAEVRTFEARCQTTALAGRWWMGPERRYRPGRRRSRQKSYPLAPSVRSD